MLYHLTYKRTQNLTDADVQTFIVPSTFWKEEILSFLLLSCAVISQIMVFVSEIQLVVEEGIMRVPELAYQD